MSARALLVEVEAMMVGAVGREEYEELLHPLQVDRGLAVLALDGELA